MRTFWMSAVGLVLVLGCGKTTDERRGTPAPGGAGPRASGGVAGAGGAPLAGSGGTGGGAGATSIGGAASGGSSTGGTPPNDCAGTGENPPGSPVARHGQLQVQGAQLVDAAGAPVQLKGMSSMWLNWENDGYALNCNGIQFMRDEWGLSVFRAAMGIEASMGYVQLPAVNLDKVEFIIKTAIKLGIYVIVDWHTQRAESNQALAEAFFADIARKYGSYPNVIYEPYNEPLRVSWDSLKPYYRAIVDTIRPLDADNLIVLGTPEWCQRVDQAAQSPLAGTNLLYALHFYSCTHRGDQRAHAATALGLGLPMFVTEWGASHANGGTDGVVCLEEAQLWHDWMNANHISWAAWKYDNCSPDSTCILASAASPMGGWTDEELHGHGPFVRDRMRE